MSEKKHINASTDSQITEGLRLVGEANGALEGVGRYISFYGADHDDDCPEDDTCDCSQKPLNDGVNKGFRTLTQITTHYAAALAEVQALRGQVATLKQHVLVLQDCITTLTNKEPR